MLARRVSLRNWLLPVNRSRISNNWHITKAVDLGISVRSLQGLAWPLVAAEDEQKRNAKVALQLAQELVALVPDGYFVARTLGVAHYRNEDWQASIDELQRATGGKLKARGENTTHHAIPWFFLAMAHWQLNEKDKAREYFDQAVQWMEENDSDNVELNRFRQEAERLIAEDKINDESN